MKTIFFTVGKTQSSSAPRVNHCIFDGIDFKEVSRKLKKSSSGDYIHMVDDKYIWNTDGLNAIFVRKVGDEYVRDSGYFITFRNPRGLRWEYEWRHEPDPACYHYNQYLFAKYDFKL